MANSSVSLEFKAGNNREMWLEIGRFLYASVKEPRLDSGRLLKEGALACLPFRRFIFLLALVWRVVLEEDQSIGRET